MFTVDIVIRLMITVSRLRIGRSLRIFESQSVIQAMLQCFIFGIVRRRWLRLLAVSCHETRSCATKYRKDSSFIHVI